MSGPRSLLFVPANRPDMLAKACSYGADALMLDLEVITIDGLAAIRLSKTESADTVRTVDALLTNLNREWGQREWGQRFTL
jgi:citrate lyase beta subunit